MLFLTQNCIGRKTVNIKDLKELTFNNNFDIQYHYPSKRLPNSYVDFDKVQNIQIIEEKMKQKKYV